MLLNEPFDLVDAELVAKPLVSHHRMLRLIALPIKVADLTTSITDQLVVYRVISLLVGDSTI